MAHGSVLIFYHNKPAVGAIFLHVPGLHTGDISTEESCGVYQVAPVCKDIVALLILFWIAFGFFCPRALLTNGHHVVGERVPVRAVAIPRLEREHLAHFFIYKLLRISDTGVESFHAPNLED